MIVGLDIGTSKVVAIVGKRKMDGTIEVVGSGSHPARGLKRGVVVNIETTVQAIQRAVEERARVYWICPLVEESEAVDLAAVAERHAQLENIFAARVGIVHGRMKSDDKDAAMSAFAGGDLDVLVATTVIEVGIDVPDATIIVVERSSSCAAPANGWARARAGCPSCASPTSPGTANCWPRRATTPV